MTNASGEQEREQRLQQEFERMLALRRPGGLVNFWCADLTDDEGSAFLAPEFPVDMVRSGIPKFLTPEQFRQKFGSRPPEKYLIGFTCLGLARREDTDAWRRGGGSIPPPAAEPSLEQIGEHLVEAVFGWDYPSNPPIFIWWTPIWHPNISPPHLCTFGRPFAVGISLDAICLLIGQMIQYRTYNVDDPLNRDAARWAATHQDMLPIDRRRLQDGREEERPLVSLIGDQIGEAEGGADSQLIEFI